MRIFGILLNIGGLEMKEMLIVIGMVVFWIVLQKYILPRLGVPT